VPPVTPAARRFHVHESNTRGVSEVQERLLERVESREVKGARRARGLSRAVAHLFETKRDASSPQTVRTIQNIPHHANLLQARSHSLAFLHGNPAVMEKVKMHEINFALAVNSDGEYEVANEQDDALERLNDNCGTAGSIALFDITIRLHPAAAGEA
jgi:hypothetical protein